MKKFTLLIDGNNFIFRCMWGEFKRTKKSLLGNNDDVDKLIKKMLLEFSSLIDEFKYICNDVIFIQDSKSWRKTLLLQHEYKGNRASDRALIDFNGLQKSTDTFIEVLRKMNVKVSVLDQCEGDDLIFGWSNYLMDKKISSLIYSTDNDLSQLLTANKDTHVIQYSLVKKSFFVCKETKEYIEKKNLYNDENLFGELMNVVDIQNEDKIKDYIKEVGMTVIDTEDVRFKKIVTGDKSDNIFPVYYKPAENGSKAKGIGEKTCEKIKEEFKTRIGDSDFNYEIFNNDESIKVLCETIYDVMGINDKQFTRRMLAENIKTNFKLVALSSDSIPKNIQESMSHHINDVEKTPFVTLSKLNKTELFKNSKFKVYNVSSSSNLFKGVEDDEDMSFING